MVNGSNSASKIIIEVPHGESVPIGRSAAKNEYKAQRAYGYGSKRTRLSGIKTKSESLK